LVVDLQEEKAKLLESEHRVSESEALFKAIFNQATIGIAIGHNDTYIISGTKDRPSINAMFMKITGRTNEELTSTKWTEITHPDDLEEDLANFKRFKQKEIDGYDMEKRYIKPDGSFAWVHMFISPLKIDETGEYNHICIIEDISKRKEMEKVLLDAERSKAIILDNLPGMAYRRNNDPEWTMQFVSEGCYELTGYKKENLIKNEEISFYHLITPKYQEYLRNKWVQILNAKIKLKEEYEIITASGEVKWVFEQGQGVYDENGNIVSLEGLIIDITERKRQEMLLKYINEHESLTGMYNRRYFQDFITNELKSMQKRKQAVLLVNFRKFNLLISTFGYTYGENLIKEMAVVLSTFCKENYRLFHIATDRFIFHIKYYETVEELIAFCNAVAETMNSSFSSKTIGGNIGVVEIDNAKSDVESILKRASIAAENANENQIFSYCFFSKEMEESLIRKTEIKNELMKTAYDDDDNSLYLMYQPIVDLKTGLINGFEALTRFKSEKMGIVSPVEFIPVAEETQLIVPIGKKITRIALKFLKQLELAGYNSLSMSVNVSAIQLMRDDFIPDLIEIISETEVNSGKVGIELTESIFSNNYKVINEKLDTIKNLGIRIAIDDFGTGYSTLARERELNVDSLKIDKYFIDTLFCDDAKDDITGDIISMAHKMGHSVIAEGVETERQKQYLIDNHCDLMQGYLFSRPLPEEAVFELLKK
jgi:PAS domain S-box/diguanylate cyclase (GGDEF) domain